MMDNILEALFSSCFVKEGKYSEWPPHISIFKVHCKTFQINIYIWIIFHQKYSKHEDFLFLLLV